MVTLERNPSVGLETTKGDVRIVTLLMQQFSGRTDPAVNWSVEILYYTAQATHLQPAPTAQTHAHNSRLLRTEVKPELNVGIKKNIMFQQVLENVTRYQRLRHKAAYLSSTRTQNAYRQTVRLDCGSTTIYRIEKFLHLCYSTVRRVSMCTVPCKSIQTLYADFLK